MINHSTDNGSLCVGRPGGIELRIHILWPLTAFVALLAVKSKFVDPTVAMWALFVLAASVAVHEFARAVTASRVGGHLSSLVLAPIGGFSKLHLPVENPPAHLVTALAGPMAYLVLLVGAGCGLALGNEHNVLRILLHPCSPQIFAPDASSFATLGLIAQLTVWINWCLLLLSLLPIEPCDGAELLRGILWPMVGRSTAASATSRIALGGALFAALLAISTFSESFLNSRLPTWFPLSIISVFLFYGGFRQAYALRYDAGLMLDEFDSDDEEWLLDEWEDEDREAVLVEHLQDKQQEAIDRKRREREANEDKQVDAILQQLRNTSFEQLSEEDRATLKRASRRYRERRTEQDEQ